MRRRLLLSGLLFLTLASCYSNPWIDSPAPPGRHRALGGSPCRVISRSRCATDACGGSNMDLVTYQCPGSRQTRCFANFTCAAR